jgi:hypothetical protein
MGNKFSKYEYAPKVHFAEDCIVRVFRENGPVEGFQAEDEEEAAKRAPQEDIQECRTCMQLFPSQRLFKCDRQCAYMQCAHCIAKDTAYVCRDPECVNVHFRCPHCRAHGGGGELTLENDDMWDAEDILCILHNFRMRESDMMEELHKTFADIVSVLDEIRAQVSTDCYREDPPTRDDLVYYYTVVIKGMLARFHPMF